MKPEKLWPRIAVLAAAGALLAGCIRVPGNLIRLSEKQTANIQAHNKALKSLADASRQDAAALMDERRRQYDSLERRGLAWHKELNRLFVNLRAVKLFAPGDARFGQELAGSERALVARLEAVLATTIGDFQDAERAGAVDFTGAAARINAGEADRVEELLKPVPAQYRTSVAAIRTYTASGAPAEAKQRLDELARILRDFTGAARARYQSHAGALLRAIQDAEQFVQTAAQRRADFEKQAQPLYQAFLESLDQIEQDGAFLVQTQADLTQSLKSLQEFEPPARSIATSFASFAKTLGDTGVLKPEEAGAITAISTGLAENILGGR